MQPKRFVITIDGLAGSGKTSIAALLSKRLGYVHFNSGLLYRAAGFLALQSSPSLENEPEVDNALRSHTIAIQLNEEGEGDLVIDGNVFREINRLTAPEISVAASKIATYPMVREYLREQQRNAFAGLNIVAEGRDMGTVIFPEAPLKFFISASVEVRSERRLNQLLLKESTDQERENLKKSLDSEILERDLRDKERKISPTIPAPDAISIENSGASLTQIVEKMYDFATQRGLVSNLVK